MRELILAIALTAATQGAAAADAFEDATTAVKRRDYASAERVLLPLAENGDLRAQISIANLYLGRFWPRHYAEAAKWYRRAADQGYYAAQYELSRMQADGWGVPRDYVSAHMWLSLAIRNGYSGRGELRALERYMTAAEISEAQKRPNEWQPRPERYRIQLNEAVRR